MAWGCPTPGLAGQPMAGVAGGQSDRSRSCQTFPLRPAASGPDQLVQRPPQTSTVMGQCLLDWDLVAPPQAGRAEAGPRPGAPCPEGGA